MKIDPNRTFLSWGNTEQSSWCDSSNGSHCLQSLVAYCVCHSFKIWKSDACNDGRIVSSGLELNIEIPIFILENERPTIDITSKALFFIFALLTTIGLNSKSTVHFCCFPHAAEIV